MNSVSNLSLCQDLAKQCMRSGQAFSISLSTNDISFSTPGFNSPQYIPRSWNSHSYDRRKTPSQRRRDQRRWEQFQNRKTALAGNPPAKEKIFQTNSPPTVNTSSESPKGVSSESDLNPPTVAIPTVQENKSSTVTPESPPASLGAESVPSSNPSVNDMEVDSLPTSISPIPPQIETAQVSSQETKSQEPLLLSQFPEDLSTALNNANNRTTEITIKSVIYSNNDSSALASLNRTLKKCNLRSFVLTQVHKSMFEGASYFTFKVQGKYVKRTLLNLKRNWISVENAHLRGFYIKHFFIENA